MGIESKLIELYRNGLEVFANKEELNYRSTSGIPKKEDIDFLKKYKNEIVTILNKDSINSSCVLGDNEIPLTEIQSAYLLGRENHFELGGVSSHVYMEVRLPLLEKSRTEDVWNNIIKEHEALRSIFTSNNTQKILKRDLYYTVEFNEGIGINGKVNSTRERLKGKRYKTNIWPLFDIVVSQVDNYSLLHLSFDFLILDWTSIWILLKEFENNYFNNVTISNSIYNLKEIRMSQLSLKKSSKYLSDKEFWESRIPTLPSSPILPIQNTTIQDKFERMQIKADTIKWTKIKSNLAKLGFTQTSFLITIMAIIINNWSSNSKFSLNLTTMNRPKKYDGIDIVNDFTATSLLEVEVNNKQLFCDLLEKIQEQIIDDLKHETFTGVETIRAIRKNTAKRNSIFPFVFTSALGVSSSDYKYIHLQEEGLSETPQVFMDCQVMEVNQELIVNFDLRSGVFSKELSKAIVESYLELLNCFSDSAFFNVPISYIYEKNGLESNKALFNDDLSKQKNYYGDIDDFNNVKSKTLSFSDKQKSEDTFSVMEVKNILKERDDFSNQVMLRTLIKIRGGIDFSNQNLDYKSEVINNYHWIINKWEDHLEKCGYLEKKENNYIVLNEGMELLKQKIDMDFLKSRWTQRIGNPDVLDYIVKISENIIDILNGKIEPISILFPQGNFRVVESIYGDNIFCKYYNEIIKTAIDEILNTKSYVDKCVKILELGAGTGNTTKTILQRFNEKRLHYRYDFTDIALSFLSNAKGKFDDYDNVEYKQIDIDKRFDDQNLKENEYDIVLAVGVLENAENLSFTISNIEKVLKNDGWLIILEPVIDEPWILMTQLFFMNKRSESESKNPIYFNRKNWINVISNHNGKEISSKIFSLGEKNKFNYNNIEIFFAKKNILGMDKLTESKGKEENNIHCEGENNSLLRSICGLARNTLKNDEVNIYSDLYECGADSLLLAQMANEIKELLYNEGNNKIDYDMIFRQLLSKPRISDLLEIIIDKPEIKEQSKDSKKTGNIGQITILNEGHELLRVIFHAGFGTMNSMKYVIDNLLKDNSSSIACITVKDSNLYNSVSNEDLVPAISREYSELIFATGYKKVQLIGYCSGGCLALETAHHLMKKHIAIDDLVLLDSYPSPKKRIDEKIIELMFLPNYNITPHMVIKDIDDNELNSVVSEIYKTIKTNKEISLLEYLGEKPKHIKLFNSLRELFSLDLEERMKLYAKTIWDVTNEEIGYEFLKTTYQTYISTFNSSNYEPFPYIGRVRYLSAKENFDLVQMEKQNVINYWKKFCLGQFSIHEIPGDHVSCVENKDNAKYVSNLIINNQI